MASTLVSTVLAAFALMGTASHAQPTTAMFGAQQMLDAAMAPMAAAPIADPADCDSFAAPLAPIAGVDTAVPTSATPSAPIAAPTQAPVPAQPSIVGAIINGAPVELARDWMVSLTIDTGKQAFFQQVSVTCGATLIAPDWIVTAAHCFSRCDSEYVFNIFGGGVLCSSGTKELIPASSATLLNSVGSSYALIGGRNVSDQSQFEKRAFAEVIVHPQFWANGGVKDGNLAAAALPYDIALVRLDAPVTTRAPIQYNCDNNVKPNALNELGFGYCLGPNCNKANPWARDSLQQTGYVSRVQCPSASMDQYTYCISGKNEQSLNAGVCSGDSGGPSVMIDPNTNTEVFMGVISWTTGCADSSQWSYMTSGILKVSQHCSWIQSVTGVAGSPAPVAPTLIVATSTVAPPKPTPTVTRVATLPVATPTPTGVVSAASTCQVPNLVTPSYIVSTCTAGAKLANGASCQLSCPAQLIPKPKTSSRKVFKCTVSVKGKSSTATLGPQYTAANVPQCGCKWTNPANAKVNFLLAGASQTIAFSNAQACGSCNAPGATQPVNTCNIKYTCDSATGVVTSQCMAVTFG